MRNRLPIILISLLTSFIAGCATFNSSEQTYIDSAQNKFDDGDFQAALESATKAVKINPNNYNAYYLEAKAYQKLNYAESAITSYAQAIKLKNNDPILLISYANFMCYQHEYGKADALYTSALVHSSESVTTSTNIYMNYADCKITQNDLDNAIIAYTKALSDESAPVSAYIGITYAYLLQKNYPTANYYSNLYAGIPNRNLLNLKSSVLRGLISNTSNSMDKHQYNLQLEHINEQLNSLNADTTTDKDQVILTPTISNSNNVEASTNNLKNVIVVREPDKNTLVSQPKNNNNTIQQNQLLSNGRTYVIVNKDDTLFSISNKSGIKIENIKKLNRMNDNKIKLGQKIYLN